MAEKGDKSRRLQAHQSQSQRQHARLHHELMVAYKSVHGFITDWATNISRGGIYINTRKPHPVGSHVRLIISLPDTAFPFDLTGRVTRVHEFDNPSNQAPGMAIEFLDVDEEKRVRIERFVDRLRRDLPDPSP
jgi:uncharacterized protein (TIGR02266 family)